MEISGCGNQEKKHTKQEQVEVFLKENLFATCNSLFYGPCMNEAQLKPDSTIAVIHLCYDKFPTIKIQSVCFRT